MSLLCHYYTYYFFYYVTYYVTADYYVMYYVTIMSLIYVLFKFFYYFRLCQALASQFSGAVSRPMRRVMTDKCPGVAAEHWDDQASSLCEAKSTYSGEQ